MTGGKPTPLPLADYGHQLAAAHDQAAAVLVTIGADHSRDRAEDARRRRAEKAAEAPGGTGG